MTKIKFIDLAQLFLSYHDDKACPDRRSRGTVRNYQKKLRRVKNWMDKEGLLDLAAEDFTIAKAKRLLREMLAGHSRNYAIRVTKWPGQVLQWGIDEEHIQTNPLFFLKLKRDNKRKIVHLTPEELTMLEGYNFISPFMGRIRDLFLWACYTGMDYGDTMSVDRSHIYHNAKDNRYYIIKSRNKELDNDALIPFFNKTRELWEKYGYQLPKISNSTYNRIIKEVIAVVGIDKRVSTHTARKTFAMIKLNNEGYSIAAVSKMLGHKSIRTTEAHYAVVSLDLISRELDEHGIAS
jgi:integrase/recombinase XerD